MFIAFLVATFLHADDLPRRASLGILFSEPGVVQEVVPDCGRSSRNRTATADLVQGGGCVSVDNIPHNWTNDIVRELTTHGYATMRVDKPGAGDSEGGPCNSASFDRELAGYRAALEAFRASPYADTRRLYLFAHSLGGTFAPFVAASMHVRGIAVYGAAFAQRPEFNDGTDKFGKDGAYWRNVYNLDVAKEWRAYHGVLLAMWGSRDTATTVDEHRALAAIHPNKSRFVTIDGTDHVDFGSEVPKTLIPWLDGAR